MTCTKCGYIGGLEDFSTTNRSVDGLRAICKRCRRDSAKKGREKAMEKAEKLPYFDLIPSLIGKRNKARIGVLVMANFVDRDLRLRKGFHNINVNNIGLMAILGELKEPYEHCPPSAINQFEFVLVSLTSVMDVENLIYNMELYAPTERKCKVVVGGFGVINIKLLVPYIDIAVFGRAEGQINDILAGYKYPNVWRKIQDPDVACKYAIRQPQYLVKGERSVGCRYKCLFCQYTHLRKPIDGACKYDPGMTVQETDWSGLVVTKAGRYNTAWDGWSDMTRQKVHKPVTNATIERKLLGIDVEGCANIKVYQIVGYPWESMESVLHDIEQTTAMLAGIDGQMRSRVTLSFYCTPFGAEPMTPMQYERVDIETNWRSLGGRVLYNGKKIKSHISPCISGGFLLMKRMMINRAEIQDIDLFKRVSFSKELLRLPDTLRVRWLLKYGAIDRDMFSSLSKAAFDYLYVEQMDAPIQETLGLY